MTAVRKIMSGPRNPRTGRQIFPGYFTSAAGEAASWPLWITGPAAPGASVQGFFGNAFFGRVVHEIPAPGVWDFSTFDFDGDMIAADAKTAHNFNANEEHLLAFSHFNRRGKIIMWHGWEDPAISGAKRGQLLRAGAARTTTTRATSSACSWCRGCCTAAAGPGPNAFGQSLPQAKPLSNSPQHDILSALERWVERRRGARSASTR